MPAKSPPDFFEAASEAWQAAMDQKNYDGAVKAGIDAYLHYRAAGNQKLSMGSLGFIHLAIAVLWPKRTGYSAGCRSRSVHLLRLRQHLLRRTCREEIRREGTSVSHRYLFDFRVGWCPNIPAH